VAFKERFINNTKMHTIQKKLNQVLTLGIVILTIFISPSFSYDPFNIPKLLLLTVMASVSFFLILPQLNHSDMKKYRFLLALLFAFMFQMTLVLAVAPGNRNQQFFGVSGRQMGFLTYLSLVVLLLCAAISSSSILQKKITKAIILSGSISILYGLVQIVGLDPIKWNNPNSSVIGFFGNPNFQASFLGMSAASISIFILSTRTKRLWRMSSVAYVIVSLLVIYQTESQQGFIVFLLGTSVAVNVFFFKTTKLLKLRFIIAGGSIVGFICLVLDILQSGPWESILYKPSVSVRGDTWRAAWKMTVDHPVFGVGLDSYRDWYFRSRDQVTVSRATIPDLADSAHNVFLDISSNAGFPLLLIYSSIFTLTVISAAKIIMRMQGFDDYFMAIFVLWIGYSAQSIISVHQISLAAWGWLTSGLIIGYEIRTRSKIGIEAKSFPKSRKFQNEIGVSLRVAAGMVTGLALSLPTFLIDADFKSSIVSGNIERMTMTAERWPQDIIRMNYISMVFQKNNLPDKAIRIARQSVIVAPDNFQAWKILYLLPNTPKSEKVQALVMMKKLNPLATDF
jgi:O-antigen ligase